jgi:hypothetical protein
VIAWSGHRSPKMIAEVYGHALRPQLDDVAAALDSMRPPSAASAKTPSVQGEE